MSHECDGDCQATAEWRQQQIRDLTERLNDAARTYSDVRRAEIDWISRAVSAEAKVRRLALLADYLDGLAPGDRHYATKIRAALGEAS